MKLNAFLKEYDALKENEQDAFLRSHIKRTYVPFMEKNNMAERAVKASCVFDDRYDPHSSIFRMFKMLDMIEAYTDIQFDRIKNGKTLVDKIYDEFQMRGLFDKLESELSIRENSELDIVYMDTRVDLEERMTSNYAMMEKFVERVEDTIGVIGNSVNDALEKAANSGLINDIIDSVQSKYEIDS